MGGGQIKDVLFVVVFGCVFFVVPAGSDVARAVWAARFQHWIQYTTALCLAGHNQKVSQAQAHATECR